MLEVVNDFFESVGVVLAILMLQNQPSETVDVADGGGDAFAVDEIGVRLVEAVEVRQVLVAEFGFMIETQ